MKEGKIIENYDRSEILIENLFDIFTENNRTFFFPFIAFYFISHKPIVKI